MTGQRSAKNRPGARPASAGLTLIEVMIALLIGSILTLVAAQIFISAKNGYRTNEAMARIQENGRYAVSFLRRAIRSADFWGCAPTAETNSVINGGPGILGPGVQGAENGANPDSITIWGAVSGTARNVTADMANPSDNVFLDDSSGIDPGDLLIVADCNQATAFMVTANNTAADSLEHDSTTDVGGITNDSSEFDGIYRTGARVFRARRVRYSINGDSELVRSINGGPNTVLVPNVAGMEIVYGTKFDVGPGEDEFERINTYVPATDFPDVDGDGNNDWRGVGAVRIELLLRSDAEQIMNEVQTGVWDFDGDGTDDDAPDNRMYQQFNATISLRNRLR